MRKAVLAVSVVLVHGVRVPTVSAATLTLTNWSVNLNGTIYSPTPLPANFDDPAFDDITGLGPVVAGLQAPVPYAVLAYFFHDITGPTTRVTMRADASSAPSQPAWREKSTNPGAPSAVWWQGRWAGRSRTTSATRWPSMGRLGRANGRVGTSHRDTWSEASRGGAAD